LKEEKILVFVQCRLTVRQSFLTVFSVRVGEFMFVARGTENHFCYRLPADRRLKTIMCRRKSVWSALAAKGWPTPKR